MKTFLIIYSILITILSLFLIFKFEYNWVILVHFFIVVIPAAVYYNKNNQNTATE